MTTSIQPRSTVIIESAGGGGSLSSDTQRIISPPASETPVTIVIPKGTDTLLNSTIFVDDPDLQTPDLIPGVVYNVTGLVIVELGGFPGDDAEQPFAKWSVSSSANISMTITSTTNGVQPISDVVAADLDGGNSQEGSNLQYTLDGTFELLAPGTVAMSHALTVFTNQIETFVLQGPGITFTPV